MGDKIELKLEVNGRGFEAFTYEGLGKETITVREEPATSWVLSDGQWLVTRKEKGEVTAVSIMSEKELEDLVDEVVVRGWRGDAV